MRDLFALLSFLGRCARDLRFSRLSIFLVILTAFASGAVSSGFIVVINSILNKSGDRTLLLWLFIALCVALPLFRFLSNVLLLRLLQRVLKDLRLSLCRGILREPLSHLERIGPARLLAALTQDILTITGAVNNIPVIVLHLGVVLTILIYLGFLSWKLLLLFLGVAILGVLSYQLPLLKAQSRFRMMREAADRLFEALRSLTEGTKELKVHAPRRRDFLGTIMEPAAESLRSHSVAGGTIYAAANSWGQSLFFVIIGLVLFALPPLRGTDPNIISGYTLALLYLMTPLDVLLNTLPDFGRAAVSVKQLEELGLSFPDASLHPEAPDLSAPDWRELSLAGVSHKYRIDTEEEPFTLGPLTTSFRPGELIFLTGGNGSGKTTLAKLLLGLYTPEEGELRLDGHLVGEAERPRYQELFSVVFYDFYLFDKLLGLDAVDLDQRALTHLASLQLERKVKVGEGRLSTLKLSQGQRKRLALLTAYLEDRSIYLFDEWAADQDPYFKEIFYHQLLPDLKARGKTVFVISHDDHYYSVADRIVKLDYGKIEYDGEPSGYLSRTEIVGGLSHG